MRIAVVAVTLAMLVMTGCSRQSSDPVVACKQADADSLLQLMQTGAWKSFSDASKGWTTTMPVADMPAALPAVKDARARVESEDWGACGVGLKPHALATIDAVVAGMEAAIAGDLHESDRQYEVSKREWEAMNSRWSEIRATPD